MGSPRFSAFVVTLAVAVAACAEGDDGGPATATHTQAIGAAPVNVLPPSQTTNEDSPLFFSAAASNPITVSDADNANLSVQITVTNGIFTLSTTSDVLVSGDSTSSVTISGAVASINLALDDARFTPAANYSGAATLQINSSDSNGEADLDVLDITVTAFNDPPVNNVPAAIQSATEDVPRSFNVSITDVDIAGAPVVVSLTASNGTLITLPTVDQLAFTAGDGAADATMTFSGALPAVNAALNGLVVTPPLNYIGGSTLVITSNDQGATGTGLPGADNDTINLTWVAVNDAPVNTVPGAQVLIEDTSLTLTGATALSVSDVDATSALVQVTLTISNGTLTLSDPAGVDFLGGDGTADVAMTFHGTLTALNDVLSSVVYIPTPNYAGFATLSMATSDLGNSGNGGIRQDTDQVALQVTGVNDAPVNVVPGPQLTNEDVARTFSIGNGNPITVTDPDAPSLQVTLTATSGTVTLGSLSGLSFQTGDGIADATVTFTGTGASVNTALNGASFAPTGHFHGAASLTVASSDLGATGTGGTRTDEDAIAVTVAPVNDPPVAINDALAIAEDAPATDVLVLGNDGFAPDQGETLTVTAVGAALHGTTSTDGTRVTYRPAANYHGSDSFTYTIGDGNGGFATAAVAVTVSSVNDAPTAADDSFSVIANSVGNSLAVLSNDSAAPDAGETMTISAVGTPLHGAVVITSGGTRLSYTSDTDYSGPDAFTYTIGDGNGGLDTATVTIDVTAVISQPVNSLPAPQTIVEDSPLFFSSVAGNAITVTDANNATLTVQVVVTSGVFTLGTTSNLTVSGNGTSSVTLSGTLAALNAGLNNARYSPASNYFGAASLTINSSDSNGETDLDVLTLAITSFNDAPVNTVPTSVEVATEDAPRAFGTVSVGDVDLSGAALLVTLTANNGTTISLPSTGGLNFSSGDGAGDPTMTFSGALASVNVALNGLTVTAPANYIGGSTLVIISNDQGSTGAGGAGQDTDTINLSWGAVNDAPVNTVPGPQVLVEDAVLAFTAGDGNPLSITDVDASNALVQVTLTATGGTVTLGNPGLVTFTSGDGTADATMTFTGTLASLNGALAASSYRPSANFTGAATLTMVGNDLGNAGSGGVKQDSDVIAIQVSAVNDAPVNGVPVAQLTNEDVARVFSASNGNPITIADADAASVQVTLVPGNGTVSLGAITGLSFQTGDGTADSMVTFTGTLGSVNGALNGTRFTPALDSSGAASLTVSSNDLGATGAGGPLGDDDVITINVAPVNDPPTAVNDAVTVSEDAPATVVAVLGNDRIAPDVGETLTITAVGAPLHGTAVSNGTTVSYTPAASYFGPDSFAYTIGDGSGATATATVVVTVTSVNDAPGAADDSFSVIAGSVGNSLAVLSNDSGAPDTGETLTISAVDAPLHGTAVITSGNTRVSYTPTGGYSGADSFTYTISDGNGGLDSATVTIDVVTVITRPVNSLPLPQTLVEDSPLFFSVGAGNPIRVSDSDNTTLTVQVVVSNGTFTLASTSGLTTSGNGTDRLTCSGTITSLNNGLDGARYTPSLHFHGPATLAINSSDSNGESDLDTLTLSVGSFNDAPVNGVPTTTQAAIEDTPRTFSTISISDVDLSGGELLVTMTASNGSVISLASTGGLGFSEGDGLADASLAFAGTLASVNVALNGLTVTTPGNYIGPSTLVITTSDQGGTGAGVVGTDTDTINLSWSAANDPPVNAVPATQTILEEGTVTFSSLTDTALTVSDFDASGGIVQVQLSASSGLLTLGNPGGVDMISSDGVAEPSMIFRGTLAQLNAALDGTSFATLADFTGTVTVTMTTNDLGNTPGPARSDVDTVSIVVGAINDAPVLVAPTTSTTNEDVTRVFSSTQANQIRIVDADATALQVSLAASAATLTLATRTNLTFQAGDGTGDGTMTFTGSPTAVNNALNGLMFIPAVQFSGIASFAIGVSDLGTSGTGGPLTTEGEVMVTVVAINDPPDAVADTATTAEDAPAIEIAVLDNDTILPDVGETLTVSALGVPLHGTAAIVAGGTRISYTPAANYRGADSVSYTVSDGSLTDTASVAITVTSVNDPPTATDDSYTVTESSSSNSLAVRGNDSAAPDSGEILTVIAVTVPAHGTAAITGPVANTMINYVPTPGYNGPDAFEYTLSDGVGGTAVATVLITVGSVDTTPVLVDDVASLAEDGTRIIAVLGNDTGIGDVPLTVVISAAASQGTAEVQPDRTVRYTPEADYQGPDSFSYTVTDADGDVDTGLVTITVTAVDDLPAAVADTLTVVEDSAGTIAVLGNDTGLGDRPVTVVVTGAPAHGTTSVSAGVVTYTPAGNYTGADSFTYRVTDGDGDLSTAAVAVNVTPVNDAPTAVDDVATTRTDEPVTVAVLGNDTDPDAADTLTVTAATVPANGTAELQSGGAIRYTPVAGYTGTDTFSYTISDGGGASDTATVSVAVGLDQDGDGLLDVDETELHGTDPTAADSDDDGLDDGDEVLTTTTDPLDDDTDDDGLLDGSEDVTDPNLPDSDDDGLLDGTELGLENPEGSDTVAADFVADDDPSSTTDPTLADTDGGGLPDGVEDDNHNGRRNPGETDPTDPSDDVPTPPAAPGGCSTSSPTSTAPLLCTLLFAALTLRRRKPGTGS